MRNGTKVTHSKYGPGRVVGKAMAAGAALVPFDGRPEGSAKVVKIADLRKVSLITMKARSCGN